MFLECTTLSRRKIMGTSDLPKRERSPSVRPNRNINERDYTSAVNKAQPHEMRVTQRVYERVREQCVHAT